jgi:hypothetical protein
MHFHVNLQQGLGNKFFMTNITLVGFISGVDKPHVYR